MTATIPMAQRPIVIKVGGEVVSSPNWHRLPKEFSACVGLGALLCALWPPTMGGQEDSVVFAFAFAHTVLVQDLD
jgi:hypothetical protein